MAIVSLDHPEDCNALSLTMTRALAEAVHRLAGDDTIGAMRLCCDGDGVLRRGIG